MDRVKRSAACNFSGHHNLRVENVEDEQDRFVRGSGAWCLVS